MNSSSQHEQEYKLIEEKTLTIRDLENINESLMKELEKVKLENKEYVYIEAKLRNDLEIALVGLTEKTGLVEELLREVSVLQDSKMRSTEELKLMKDAFEESKAESSIFIKRSQNEIKEIKYLLVSEKENTERLLKERDELLTDKNLLLQKIGQSQQKAPTSVGPQNGNSQEVLKNKNIAEALAKRAQVLGEEVSKLQNTVKNLETKVVDMEKVINAKTNVINIFLSELYEKLPNGKDLFEKLDKDDLDSIKSFKTMTSEELQILLEKVFLENSRLKNDLLMLGNDFNNILRKQEQNR